MRQRSKDVEALGEYTSYEWIQLTWFSKIKHLEGLSFLSTVSWKYAHFFWEGIQMFDMAPTLTNWESIQGFPCVTFSDQILEINSGNNYDINTCTENPNINKHNLDIITGNN